MSTKLTRSGRRHCHRKTLKRKMEARPYGARKCKCENSTTKEHSTGQGKGQRKSPERQLSNTLKTIPLHPSPFRTPRRSGRSASISGSALAALPSASALGIRAGIKPSRHMVPPATLPWRFPSYPRRLCLGYVTTSRSANTIPPATLPGQFPSCPRRPCLG